MYDIAATRNRMVVKLSDEYAAECGRELSASDRTSIQAQVASSGAATVVRWWSRR